jgi:two-component system sensor histidine kinase KdpD
VSTTPGDEFRRLRARVARLEGELRSERDAVERLRVLDEMKNTFLAAVSHDLRTPLAAILGLALTLEQQTLDEEESREFAGRIAANARKLDRMVQDLLDLDRLTRGIVEPILQPLELDALVERTVGEFDAGRHPVEVDAEHVVAYVDNAKVERIVENLLVNAARHTPSGSRIWVGVRPDGEGALISVEDEGPGIPEAQREDIFLPFHKTGDPDLTPGAGIGLALVARFAELQNGRVWVEDRQGGGAAFRVWLPSRPGVSAA